MAGLEGARDGRGKAVVRLEASFRGRLGSSAVEGVESVQIKISARHGHINEATQGFIREKAQKLTRLFERLTMIEVTVDLGDKIYKKVEIQVDCEHKHDFVAHDQHEQLLGAVELAFDRIQHQVHRYKEKIQDRR